MKTPACLLHVPRARCLLIFDGVVDRSHATGSAGGPAVRFRSPAGPGSGVVRAPDRQVAVEVDAAEGHVGEVDAVSDRVGPGEFREEAGAQAGGLLVVEVEGVFPERVGDLEGEWKAITRRPPASMT